MNRAQCIVHRGPQILMVRHQLAGETWWCLPGGGVEPGESPVQEWLRELKEECSVEGKIIKQVGEYIDDTGIESITFLVDIANQEPHLGNDPEFKMEKQILVELRWMSLAEIPERDRAYLWNAGLMNIPLFYDELTSWGDALSYPLEK
jgi:8-oxo-dGTP diphosphatase